MNRRFGTKLRKVALFIGFGLSLYIGFYSIRVLHDRSEIRSSQRGNRIKSVYRRLVLFDERKGRPSRTIEELGIVAQEDETGWRAIESGQIIVQFGVRASSMSQSKDQVLAFEANAQTDGGYVLFADGAAVVLDASNARRRISQTKTKVTVR
jgi:hypothetical protein